MGWDGWDLSQTTTTTRAPLAVLKKDVMIWEKVEGWSVVGTWFWAPAFA